MSSALPLIGIPCRHDLSVIYRQKPVNAQNDAYMEAVTQAGGIPFLIPLNLPDSSLKTLYDLADGIILSGGGDVDPAFYHQSPHPTQGDVQPDRDREEITLSRWAAADRKPLLAICRGIQVVAVSAGGMLYQDLPSQLPEATLHRYEYNNNNSRPPTCLAHTVDLTPASPPGPSCPGRHNLDEQPSSSSGSERAGPVANCGALLRWGDRGHRIAGAPVFLRRPMASGSAGGRARVGPPDIRGVC